MWNKGKTNKFNKDFKKWWKKPCQVIEFQEGDITFNLEHKEKIYEGGNICPRLLEVDWISTDRG